MKNSIYSLLSVLAPAILLVCCTGRFPSGYTLELPEAPAEWVSILGEPHWRVEWVDPGGQMQMADYPPRQEQKVIEAEIPVTWTNPVLAWPFWPSLSLPPNIFKPAGALFPFDVLASQRRDARLRLSWEAGPDAVFYKELTLAYDQNGKRTPVNFDWPRYRELFKTDALSEAVREDPWVVNWSMAAERTVASNFDRRRIVPEAVNARHIPAPGNFHGSWQGPWYSISPFAKPLFFEEGELAIFPVRPGINVWFSAEGILRVNGNSSVFEEKKVWQK